MDFQLSDDHHMLQDRLRGILTRHSGDPFMPALLQAGVLKVLLTEAEGSFNGSGAAVTLIFQELDHAAALMGTMIRTAALAHAGQPAHENATIAFAGVEPGTRYDRGEASTADGDRLTGCKTMMAGVDAILVTTVDALWRVAPDEAGLTIRPSPLMDDQDGADLIFDATPATRRGALAGFGGALAQGVQTHAAYALAGIMTAVDRRLDYLRMRKQSGQPLMAFRALAHRAADLSVEMKQARSAAINIAGHPDADAPLRDRPLQAFKVTLGRRARLMAEESVQMPGGIVFGGLIHRLLAADTAMGDADAHMERLALGEPAFA